MDIPNIPNIPQDVIQKGINMVLSILNYQSLDELKMSDLEILLDMMKNSGSTLITDDGIDVIDSYSYIVNKSKNIHNDPEITDQEHIDHKNMIVSTLQSIYNTIKRNEQIYILYQMIIDIKYNLKKYHYYVIKMNFKDEVTNNKLSNREPEVMRNRVKISSGRSNLSNEELDLAKNELINIDYLKLNFPRTIKLRQDPPLPQQNFCVFTFTPSVNAKPDKDNVFGILKIRGCFNTVQECDEHAENIIRNVDSYNENVIGYVGKEFPLSLDSKYCSTTKEIDIRMKNDSVARENMKAQRESEKKEMEEIQARQQELLSDTAKEMCFDDLDYYIQLKVKKANLMAMKDTLLEKLQESENIVNKSTKEIDILDEKFPDYKNQYQKKYQESLDAVGAGSSKESDKMIEYMK